MQHTTSVYIYITFSLSLSLSLSLYIYIHTTLESMGLEFVTTSMYPFMVPVYLNISFWLTAEIRP